MSIARRAVLAGAAALATGLAAGCDIPTERTAVWHPAPDVLLPLLQRTVQLRDRYGEALTAFPALQDRLGPLKDDHEQHVIALAREIGLPEAGPFPQPSASSGSPSALPTDQGAALTELTNLERKGREEAEGACLAAPSYRAALLGSIAACRAGHVEVLT
ncbi:hypothetical protein KZZ52_07865 [Dactylosporangium sp. AC04546]|uniref:hypothetical protein n=1 Tax=Dactylosporangium sp. AC04546 TaxID=2862460 RepID=UPI001EDF0E0E|nr:hypothetical protein [Dactylosporangium sp. AC04546]WVK85301.1 hypothetical protein KZZ52_07865 [Dactylosporangium sp. AC04546]